jgi:cyclopropane-fatty-acyl-phospholipid synthase
MRQAITIADQHFRDYSRNEDFIQKHIFPGGFLPSMGLMAKIANNRTGLVIRDVLDIGEDYAQMLAH